MSVANRPPILSSLHNVPWISAPWHFNKSEVHARAAAAQSRSAQRSLLGSHSALRTTQLCGWKQTFMTTHPELRHDDGWGKNSHNSFLDINDLWHLRWKSLQLHSAADRQGGILAGWIMPNMKGTKMQSKTPSKLLACNINLWQKNTVSLYSHQFKSTLIVPTHGAVPLPPCRGQCLDENDGRILMSMETSLVTVNSK